jgi:hypothetical protein
VNIRNNGISEAIDESSVLTGGDFPQQIPNGNLLNGQDAAGHINNSKISTA